MSEKQEKAEVAKEEVVKEEVVATEVATETTEVEESTEEVITPEAVEAKEETPEEVVAPEVVEVKEQTPQATEEASKEETPEEVVAPEVVEVKEETPQAIEEASKEETPEVVVEESKEEAPEAKEEKVAEAPEEAPKAKKEVKKEIPGDFDWDAVDTKGFGEGYTSKEVSDLTGLYDGTLNTITEKEVIKAIVVSVNARDVILNIGFKSDGLISASEFRDTPDLKQGDEVEVYVEEQENASGQLVLSRKKAKIVKAWENIQDSHDKDSVIEGMVKRRTKGGLIVDIFGVEAFLPGSQIDVKPIRDFDIFVDKKMEVKVVKINYSNDNVVVSHKVLIEKDLEAQRTEILNNLEKGQVLEGVIKNMTNFGVFIDLGGVDGLLHITDISWGRINHPEDVLNLDETVKIVVLDFDDNKKRISLGMKQLTEHPWDSLSKDLEIGSKIKGKIVNVADYGAFLEIQPGVEGLIHVSEMSWSQHLRNPQDFIKIGDVLEAVVLTLERDDRKMSLGIKQLSEDPWTKSDVLSKYAIGTNHKGVVRNLTNFGLFLELEEGIDGLVHVSDLSWTKKIKHPSEFVAVNEDLEVQVLELDVDNRRLALGHKQLEENPWDTFESVFTPGSVHKCTVVTKIDKGAILELPYGIDGFVSNKNLKKEDGASGNVGETLDFKVLEFSKSDKRIALSHAAVYSGQTDEIKVTKKPKKAKSTVKNQEAKSTLGDLEALSALKDKMGAPAAAAEKEAKAEEDKAAKPKASKKAAPKKAENETAPEAPEADAKGDDTEAAAK